MGNDAAVEAILEEAGGPLTWHNSEVATAIIDGQQILVTKKYARGGGPLHLSGAEFSYDLGGRPIHLNLHSVEHTTIKEDRRLRTGDPEFDREMAVEGWPEEVVVAALDEDARRYLPGAVRPRWPFVWVEDGCLRMAPSIFHSRGRQAADAADIAGAMRFVAGTGGRLVDAYDARLEEIRRTQGDSAAAAWQEGSEQRSTSRARGRALAGFGWIVVVVAIAAGVTYAMVQGWF